MSVGALHRCVHKSPTKTRGARDHQRPSDHRNQPEKVQVSSGQGMSAYSPEPQKRHSLCLGGRVPSFPESTGSKSPRSLKEEANIKHPIWSTHKKMKPMWSTIKLSQTRLFEFVSGLKWFPSQESLWTWHTYLPRNTKKITELLETSINLPQDPETKPSAPSSKTPPRYLPSALQPLESSFAHWGSQ